MATGDIKSLLDAIIDDGSHVKTSIGDVPSNQRPVNAMMQPVKFNTTDFREKLSLCVLRDVIGAMMHDDTADIGDMIDESIMKHIKNDYSDTCFGYLCKSRDRLNSPVLGDIVQEIEDASKAATEDVEKSGLADKDPDAITKEILKNVRDYDELRELLKEKVSQKVVKDVSNVIVGSNDAPVFDKIDEKISVDRSGQTPANNEQLDMATSESSILKMCGKIVTEYAINKTPISTEEGLQRSIITYCLGEMDALFKADPTRSIVGKYL